MNFYFIVLSFFKGDRGPSGVTGSASSIGSMVSFLNMESKIRRTVFFTTDFYVIRT